ncbi:MAG: hypothetical protein ACWGSD_01500 [Thermodesulfobacteriota bacterium]
MKLWRSMLAMLVCSGVIIALGITACGGDDKVDNGMTCEKALATLTSDTCIGAVEAACPAFRLV